MKNTNIIQKEYDRMYSNEVNKKPSIKITKYPKNRYEFAMLHAGSGYKVVDVGMGDGQVLYSLKNNFTEFLGLELSNNRIHNAESLCESMNTSFFNKSIEDEGIVQYINNVDTVICLDVIDHVIDVRKSLENIFTMLNDDGKLILTLPNIGRINCRLNLMLGKFPATSTGNQGLELLGNSNLLDGGKLHYFTFKSMIELLSQIGYKRINKFGIGKHSRLYNLYPALLSGSISLVCYKSENK